ncbi:MAG: hypothetical protein HYV63_20470 [Candidatus Schekmanbacteria bacterium]|nr:hypothetical protein [Candidatus Schekmanbacteria bacterium]
MAAMVTVGFGTLCALAEPTFFYFDDLQSQYLPVSQEMSRAVWSGELPLVTDLSWAAAPLAGEYQYGTFNAFLVLLYAGVWPLGLPLHQAATVLCLAPLAILSAGAFRLARLTGLPRHLGLLVAVTGSLNGWILSWGVGWYPALASFAWIPWFWGELEIVRRGAVSRPRPHAIAVYGYLIATSGWPFTDLMALLLASWCGMRCALGAERWVRLRALALGGLGALALSAPAWLMLLAHGPATARAAFPNVAQDAWTVPGSALLGLFLPSFNAFWRTWGGQWTIRPSAELFNGLVAPIGALIGLGTARWRYLRAHRWELGLLGAVFALAVCPSYEPFRWSFRWLPLLHLLIGLLGAHGLNGYAREAAAADLRPAGGRRSLSQAWPGALAAALIAILLTRHHTGGMVAAGGTWPAASALALAVAIVWSVASAALASRRAALQHLPLAVALAAAGICLISLPHVYSVPRWALDERDLMTAPGLSPDRLYLSVYSSRLDGWSYPRNTGSEALSGIPAGLYHGNTFMHAGRRFVNGYSPMMLGGIYRQLRLFLHGSMEPRSAQDLLRHQMDETGLLATLGVDGLILSHDFFAMIPVVEAAGWRVERETVLTAILHRERPVGLAPRVLARLVLARSDREMDALVRGGGTRGPDAVARLADLPPGADLRGLSAATINGVHTERATVTFTAHVRSPSARAVVLLPRPYLEGYTALLDDRAPLRVFPVNDMALAIELPPSARGTVALRYEPRAAYAGLLIAAIAAVALGVTARSRAPDTRGATKGRRESASDW